MEKRFASENFPPEIQALADQMNLDRSRIHPYTVPRAESSSGAEFINQERPHLLKKFAQYLYGEIPGRTASMHFDIAAENRHALNGKATRREIVIRCCEKGQARCLNLLIYIPNQRNGRVPVWFGLNFKGNHACTDDPEVLFTMTKRYPCINNSIRLTDDRAGLEGRGVQKERWCFETLIDRGYAAATMCYYDPYPDHRMGFPDSIMSLFYSAEQWNSDQRPSTMISAWAWGISRAVDCLESQPELDSSKIAVHGHSRLGKAALWAGANDTRIALTVSCCSGCCGAKLTRRYCGEDLAWIDLWNPEWIMPATRQYLSQDWNMPVEQNQLLGCIAPRYAYITSATEDEYADPEGEFLAAREAGSFYALFGSDGIGSAQMPQAGVPLNGDIGYYLRPGRHNITPENWEHLLNYTDLHRWKANEK